MIVGVPSNYPNAMGLGISNNLYYNNANSGLTATTIKGAIDELNTNKQDALPAAPAADGTYFLSTTISSGTATQSWVSIPAANGNNF